MKERKSTMRTYSNRPAAGRAANRAGGFTGPQLFILAVVGLLGVGLVALTAGLLLGSPPPASEPFAPAAAPGASQANSPLPTPTLEATQPALPAGLLPGAASLPIECARQASEVQSAALVKVMDDGTIEAAVNGQVQAVELAGVQIATNSPSSASAEPAARFLNDLLEGQPLVLVKDPAGADETEKPARYIFAGGRFMNYELVREGLARVDEEAVGNPGEARPGLACAALLLDAQALAQEDRLGIWRPTPVPTLTFMPLVPLDPDLSICDCSIRYTCDQFSSRDQAQACFNACNDYNSRLDEDRDGIACENLQ